MRAPELFLSGSLEAVTPAKRRTVAIILHYGQPTVTADAVRSVLESTVQVEVVVVNNGRPHDLDTIVGMTQRPELVSVVEAGSNLGFAAGVNLGIGKALAPDVEHIFLLNNDAIVEPRTLEQLIRIAEQRSDLGILVPVICYADQPDRVWSAGSRLRRGILWTDLVPVSAPPGLSVAEVDVVTGCAMLVTRATIDRVGSFDERYFMYYEDVDYCIRVKNAGLRVGVVGGATAYHKVGPQPRLADPARVYVWARSKAVFYTRLAGRRSGAQLVVRLVAGSLAFGWQCIRRRDMVPLAHYAQATVHGWRSAWIEGDNWST